MTETTAPITVAPAPPCRARTTFPWQGRLRTSVTFTGGSYAEGTLVAVTGQAEGGFSVRVGRVQDPPGPAPVTGRVTRDQVDEVLGAVIEASLLGKQNITWDNNGLWKDRCYVVTQDFLLTEEGDEGDPPKHVMFYQGERVAAMPGGAGYYIAKNGVAGDVVAGRLRLDTSIPSPVSNVALLCYEFGLYAAALAGLCPDFVSRAKAAGNADDKGSYWAVDVAGGTLSDPTVGRQAMAGLALQRGDFVLFYQDDRADSSVHTAFATGDAQGLYSLWDKQSPRAVRTSVQELFDLPDEAGGETPMVSVRTARPRWHQNPA